MAKLKKITVEFSRKREKKTKYSKRLKLLLSHQNRLVVRITNKKVIAQIVQFSPQGDRICFGTNSSVLEGLGWKSSFKNIPAAYLFGLFFGKSAFSKGYKEAILDTGFRTPVKKGKIYAFLKGVLDAGLKVPHDVKVLPDESRLKGEHISGSLADSVDMVKKKIGIKNE